MTLFYSRGACSLVPHIVLHELGFPCRLEKVDLRAKTYSGGDYRTVNPKGAVPALKLDSGEVLTENAIILQYLADQKPESTLLPPAGSLERYRCLEWVNFITTDLHKTFSPLWNQKTPEEYRQMCRETLLGRFAFVSKELGSKSFLMGENFTIADPYLFVILRWAFHHKLDISEWPNLRDFTERVRQRPSVDMALREESN